MDSLLVMDSIEIKNELVKAIFNIDVDGFKRLIESNRVDVASWDNICDAEGDYCPIQWIVQCWEMILENPDAWCEDCRETIRQKKMDNQEIKKILFDKFNLCEIPIEINNNELWIYRYDMEDSFEDCFDSPKEEMLLYGYKEIDLDLYWATYKYDFEEVERLLKMGADSNYYISEVEDSCKDLIGYRCADFCMDFSSVLFDDVKWNPFDDNCNNLAYLIAWAVNEKMYNLLLKYSATPKENI